MFRCPRCQAELPANASFCNNCGFTQTNARMEATQSQRSSISQNTPPSSVAKTSPRAIQPSNKHTTQARGKTGASTSTRPSAKVPLMRMPSTPLPPTQLPKQLPTLPPSSSAPASVPETPRPENPNPVIPKSNTLLGRYRAEQQAREQANQAKVALPATSPERPESSEATPQPQQSSSPNPPAAKSPTNLWFSNTPAKEAPAAKPPAAKSPANLWFSNAPVSERSPEHPYESHSKQVVVRESTPPPSKRTPYKPTEPSPWDGAVPDTPASVPVSNESLAATSKAAQHWRKSWRNRQRAEAGPAVGVSRGQAAVPEPLMAMQHSIARMRAIIAPKEQESKQSFSFWLIVAMLVCLIGGLGAYIASTYLSSGTQLTTSIVSTGEAPEPTLVLKDSKNTTIAAGQTIQVHGEHFKGNDAITFAIDTTPVTAPDGRPFAIQSNSAGTFDAPITIPAAQPAGEYALQAQDNRAGEHAFLNLQITSTASDTTSLTLSSQGNPVSKLSFARVVGDSDPESQTLTLTNNSDTPLQWSTMAVSDNQLGWLIVENSKTSGTLNARETDTVVVSIYAAGLQNSKKPYTGEVIFTVANQGQVILPVQLQVVDTAVEMVVDPNPLIAGLSTTAPGACQDTTTLTLINLSDTIINWSVKPDDDHTQSHITLDGKPNEGSQLQPSGFPGDTKVIKLTCNGVQADDVYNITVYYNGIQQHITIIVRRSF